MWQRNNEKITRVVLKQKKASQHIQCIHKKMAVKKGASTQNIKIAFSVPRLATGKGLLHPRCYPPGGRQGSMNHLGVCLPMVPSIALGWPSIVVQEALLCFVGVERLLCASRLGQDLQESLSAGGMCISSELNTWYSFFVTLLAAPEPQTSGKF